MGLRRAQGPDGGLTASTYSYLGGESRRGGGEGDLPKALQPRLTPSLTPGPGFDGSSNVLAGQLRGVPLAGTLAHSFVTSFSGTEVPPDQVSTSHPCCTRQQTPKPVLAQGRVVQLSLMPCVAHLSHPGR